MSAERPGSVPLVIVVAGPAGVGKTTVGRALAASLGWAFHDADDFHPHGNLVRMHAGHALTDAERGPWLAALRDLVARTLAAGDSAVLACSALRRDHRRALVPPGREDHVLFVQLRAPASVLAARLEGRADHFFPPALLPSQLAALEDPGPAEPSRIITIDATQPVDDIVAKILGQLHAGD